MGDETVVEASNRCLQQVLGLPEDVTNSHLEFESFEEVEEIKDSPGFPGMLTVYSLHVVHLRVKDPTASSLAGWGLPEGVDFQTSVANTFVYGSVREWTWVSRSDFLVAKKESSGRIVSGVATATDEYENDEVDV